MKHLLLTTIAAVVLVGCGPSASDISIHQSAFDGNIEAVKQHLAAGTDVNAKDEWGGTPLHSAAYDGDKAVAELLIENGADVNAKGFEGMTPLLVAAGIGHMKIAELLITKGADVNAKVLSGPKQGFTPLDAANENNHPETADLLRKHGGKTSEELKAEGK